MYVKRFYIEANVPEKKYLFISETPGSRLYIASTAENPEVEITILKGRKNEEVKEIIGLSEFIDIKGWKSQGNRLSQHEIKKVVLKKEEDVTEEDPKEAEKGEKGVKEKTGSKNLKVGSQMEWDMETDEKKLKDGKQTKLF